MNARPGNRARTAAPLAPDEHYRPVTPLPNWLAAPAPDISHGPRRQTALQAGLRSALTAPHDSERGSAAATAALLSDDHGIILARRILDAARAMRDLCGGRR